MKRYYSKCDDSKCKKAETGWCITCFQIFIIFICEITFYMETYFWVWGYPRFESFFHSGKYSIDMLLLLTQRPWSLCIILLTLAGGVIRSGNPRVTFFLWIGVVSLWLIPASYVICIQKFFSWNSGVNST